MIPEIKSGKWNGRPASINVVGVGEEGSDSFVVWARIGAEAPARLTIRRHFFWRIALWGMPRVHIPAVPSLAVRSNDAAFAVRALSDEVLARTLPLAITSVKDAVSIDGGWVIVTRSTDVPADGVAAAWSLARLLVTRLQLPFAGKA